MDKHTQLEALEQEIIAQYICPELAAQATQLVMGDGSVDADILFIGEAPGKKEDERGVPFVGAAGKFLDVMLEAAGLVRADVYITNIVKYRPPNNRDPLTSEKAAFWPYLLRQIDIINPRVIVTLGRHSMEYFVPDAQIGDVHGSVIRAKVHDRERVIVPLYHPAAALYNGSLRQTLLDDFMRVTEVASARS